jgi:hypothetical protein
MWTFLKLIHERIIQVIKAKTRNQNLVRQSIYGQWMIKTKGYSDCLEAVLRIRDVYPGSRIRIRPFFGIPDPGSGSDRLLSRIPDPGPGSGSYK